MSKLVIVESPAKVETIRKYLPSDYEVDSCVGHVRDLPRNADEAPASIKDEDWADYGVNVDEDFEPVYVTISGKDDVLDRLRRKLDDAEELYLATDEDREGESISWHLKQTLDPDVPVKRMVFNEITEEAVEHARENPRDIDMSLVEAQEVRRILDRLYGYTLSPLLWRKIKGGLSAGRVQSPAVRLVVMRERERRAFNSAEYWDLEALLAENGDSFEAYLHTLEGTRIASGSDFDEETGELEEGIDRVVLDEDDARELADELTDVDWEVADVEDRPRQSSPPDPFKTSTLQQTANSRLNMSPGQTMSVAQDLYEDGHITYMRTDSTHLSDEALDGAKKAIEEEWGENLYEGPTHYDADDEQAQEAHEAIRPAGDTFDKPSDTGLTGRHRKLYDLIYRRTLATQMPNERYTSTTVLVDADDARFKATGKHVDFPGYRLAWPTSSKTNELPDLTVGDELDPEEITPKGHETQPPSRYTEASLVEALEEEDIGRPSTYANIIERIQEKEYVKKHGRSLVPTLTAFAVTRFLEDHFPRLIDLKFTADMEQALDEIAKGEAESLPYLEEFFKGEEGLEAQANVKNDTVEGSHARQIGFEDLDYTVKVGRYGPYVEHENDEGEVVRANLPNDLTPDEIDEDLVQRLIKQEDEGPTPIGTHSDTGEPVYVLTGRYGPYVQLGDVDEDSDEKPPRASLPDGLDVDEVDLETALWLLELPIELGEHPDGGTVLAGIGRYGPYVCQDPPGDEDRTYKNVSDWETLREITLDEAVNRIEQSKKGKKRGVIREMGEHPDTGDTIELRGGRYGPYFKHQDTNKSLPDELDIEDATHEDAVFLVSLPIDLGEHPDGGRVVKDWGRYGPYVARDEDGDRTYVSLRSYEDIRQTEFEDALWLLDLPHEIGEHPKGGTILVTEERDGAYLAHEIDSEEHRIVRGLTAPELRELTVEDALEHF
jgi:DNA topoisomerase-1